VSRRASLLFAALAVAWGIPYLLIKVAGGELPPSTLVLARTGLAALLLLPLALARGQVGPVLRRWRPVLAYAVVEIVVPWFFLARAEQELPSSTTGLLIAAVPLVAVLVVLVTGRAERLGPRGWLGLAAGTLGVAALVGLDVAGSDLGAVAEVGVVVLGYAIGPALLARRLGDVGGLGVMAVSVTMAALVYVPVVALGPGLPDAVPATRVLLSVVVLAVVCTAAAFLLLFALVGELGPVRALSVVYVNPLVAIVAGAALLGERISAWTVVGFALVLAGSFLVTRPARARRPATAAPARRTVAP
jgi:drug/metabolite transporter (DMT)-like permease